MLSKLVVTLAVGVFMIAGSPAHAGGDPAAACKATKAKGTGKKASALLKAFGKNLKKTDDPKLAQAISKAGSKFTKAFTKAEANGQCLTSGDSGAIGARMDVFVADVLADLSAVTSTTSTTATPTTTTTLLAPTCGDNTANHPSEECDGTDNDECLGARCLPDCTCPSACCAIYASGQHVCNDAFRSNVGGMTHCFAFCGAGNPTHCTFRSGFSCCPGSALTCDGISSSSCRVDALPGCTDSCSSGGCIEDWHCSGHMQPSGPCVCMPD